MPKAHAIVISSLFILLSLPASALLKDLVINADKVTVDKINHRIEASGSVEVAYQDFILYGGTLIYNTSAETCSAGGGFKFLYNGLTLEGESLDFDLVAKQGEARQASFNYEKVKLAGGLIKFNREEYELKDASFSTCDLPVPHYKVTASDILLYPSYGWMVAYWGVFWVNNIPIVPMPTYIYDYQAEAHNQRNLPPFPMVGNNADDGTYIAETLAWNVRRELTGTYTIDYATNKGFGVGGTANYIVNPQNNGNARLYWNGNDKFYGGITHLYSFGTEVKSSETPLFDFFKMPQFKQYQVQTTLSYHERINYQRVSFYPDLVLRTKGSSLTLNNLKYDFEIGGGMVAEKGNTKLGRAGGYYKLYYNFPETSVGLISPSVIVDALFYSNGGKWLKPAGGIDIAKKLTNDVQLKIGYNHFFIVDGQSPFLYEMYHFRASDTLKADVKFKIGETAARVAASYFLDNWSPQDIDYTLFFKLHCYNLEATYRSLRQEFNVGVSLASQ